MAEDSKYRSIREHWYLMYRLFRHYKKRNLDHIGFKLCVNDNRYNVVSVALNTFKNQPRDVLEVRRKYTEKCLSMRNHGYHVELSHPIMAYPGAIRRRYLKRPATRLPR